MEEIRIENLTFTYPGRETPALKNISLKVEKGDFIVVCGYSGSGKSTLLRLLKPSLSPQGKMSGEIYFDREKISTLSVSDDAEKIGFVMQSPESQTVTEKVMSELAFSLESIGLDSDTIRQNVTETAAFFGIDSWLNEDISTLSGGQKQMLALASAVVLQPELLILDEPTSQLDPIASSELFSALLKINRETGTTVILSEHRLEEALTYADKVAVTENGELIFFGTAEKACEYLKETKNGMFSAMPSPARVWGSVRSEEDCPLTVNAGRRFLSDYIKTHKIYEREKTKEKLFGEELIAAENVYFRYEKESPDILKGFSLSAHRGELMCIFGSNGSGKTTALGVLAGIKSAYRGSVQRNGKTALLPQNVQSLFVKKTVLEDLYDVLSSEKLPKDECESRIKEVAERCRIETVLSCHPYDISGGERQKAALAKVLLTSPDILLLDEPTKGLDAPYKKTFAEIINGLKNDGVCIIAVSHDIEFCAEYADTCALFSSGSFAAVLPKEKFFSSNSFYTSSAERMSRNIIAPAVTADEIIETIGGKRACEEIRLIEKKPSFQVKIPEKNEIKKLPLFRKIGAFVCGISAFILLLVCSLSDEMKRIVGENELEGNIQKIFVYGIFILSLLLLAGFISTREKTADARQVSIRKKEKLSKKAGFFIAVSVILVPITLLFGLYFFEAKQYYITALLIVTECMLPFFFIFEDRKKSAGEIALVAVLCAIAVAGRAAFFMLPQFKPVAAVVIVSGVMLGTETGFAVGAISMLVSNMLFSQGPWTPCQMFAMGMTGLIAGLLSGKGILKQNKYHLSIFGFISVFLIYGVAVNMFSALMQSPHEMNLRIILTCFAAGLPMDAIHAFSTAIFLFFGAEPMCDILERIKIKYAA